MIRPTFRPTWKATRSNTISPTKERGQAMSDCGCEENDEFAALADVADEGAGAVFDPPDPRGTTVRRFRRQLLAPYGKPTGDKRRFATGALTARPLPIPMKWQRADNQGHSESVSVGRIDEVEFADDGVYGSGIFFTPDPEKTPRWAEDCEEAFQLTKQGVIGPSVDLDAMDFHEYQGEDALPADPADADEFAARPEIEVTRGRISAITQVQIPAFAEARPFAIEDQDADEYAAELEAYGNTITAAGVFTHDEQIPVADVEWDLEHWITEGSQLEGAALYSGPEGDLFPVADVVEGQLALVPGAVADAISMLSYHPERIALPEGVKDVLRARLSDLAILCELPTPPWEQATTFSLVAAGTIDGWVPDREMFENPDLDRPTPIQVKNGRVFGHLATWGACHIGFKHCVKPPRSRSNYAHFHVGEIETTNGPLAVGKLTLGGGHADTQLGFQAAAEHYDDAGTAVAAVRAGEDRHGIWVSGVALPGRENDFATLPLYPLSGDWRRIGGSMEMIAALAVNTPGFSIPRVSHDRGRELALVAAGTLLPEHEAEGDMIAFRDVSPKMRAKLADKGQANSDGSYPIATVEDLQNAIQAYGRAGNKPATKRLIIKMAKKLKRPDLIPEGWEAKGEKDTGPDTSGDYAISDELAALVLEEWADEIAASAFEDDAVTADASFEGMHPRGHGKFIKKLLGMRGGGSDKGAGGPGVTADSVREMSDAELSRHATGHPFGHPARHHAEMEQARRNADRKRSGTQGAPVGRSGETHLSRDEQARLGELESKADSDVGLTAREAKELDRLRKVKNPGNRSYAADEVVAAFRREAENARLGRILGEELDGLGVRHVQHAALEASTAF
jgi:hypothetical protein